MASEEGGAPGEGIKKRQLPFRISRDCGSYKAGAKRAPQQSVQDLLKAHEDQEAQQAKR